MDSFLTEKQKVLTQRMIHYQLAVRDIAINSEDEQRMTYEFTFAIVEHIDILLNYVEPLLDKGASFSNLMKAWESYMEWYHETHQTEEQWDSVEVVMLPIDETRTMSEMDVIRSCFLVPFYGEPCG